MHVVMVLFRDIVMADSTGQKLKSPGIFGLSMTSLLIQFYLMGIVVHCSLAQLQKCDRRLQTGVLQPIFSNASSLDYCAYLILQSCWIVHLYEEYEAFGYHFRHRFSHNNQ